MMPFSLSTQQQLLKCHILVSIILQKNTLVIFIAIIISPYILDANLVLIYCSCVIVSENILMC